MRVKLDRNGMTLLEILIALAITAILTIVVAQVISIYIRNKAETSAYSEVNQNLRVAFVRLEKEIYEATSIQSPATGVLASELQLDVATGASCQPGANVQCFYVEDGRLKFRDGTTLENLTSADVAVTTFSVRTLLNGTKRSIQVNLKLRYSGTEQAVYEKEIRNAYVLQS